MGKGVDQARHFELNQRTHSRVVNSMSKRSGSGSKGGSGVGRGVGQTQHHGPGDLAFHKLRPKESGKDFSNGQSPRV